MSNTTRAQIREMLDGGMKQADIARALGISRAGVKYHVQGMRRAGAAVPPPQRPRPRRTAAEIAEAAQVTEAAAPIDARTGAAVAAPIARAKRGRESAAANQEPESAAAKQETFGPHGVTRSRLRELARVMPTAKLARMYGIAESDVFRAMRE